jgi:hypothetical protein
MTDLLPSQEKAYQDKIKELEADKKSIYASALRHCTRIINLSDLSDDQKQSILEEIWEGI